MSALPFTAHAEGESGSLLNGQKVWTMGFFSPYQEGEVDMIEYRLDGDTIIGNVTYMRQYQRELKKDEGTPQEWKATGCFIGQTGSRIFYYQKGNQEDPQLLMDFSVTAGDVIPYNLEGMPSYLMVENVSDTILISSTDRQSRKCIYVKDIEYNVNDVWIENIGSLEFGIEAYFMNRLSGSIPRLLRCTDGGTVLYEHPDAAVILSISHPLVQNWSSDFVTYDLQGRRLESQPEKGIYIQNGKKVMIK